MSENSPSDAASNVLSLVSRNGRADMIGLSNERSLDNETDSDSATTVKLPKAM